MFLSELFIKLKVFLLELSVKIESVPDFNIFILFFSMFFSMVLFRLLKNQNLFLFTLSLPATFFHELAHFVVSFVLFGKPNKISIIPKRSENGWTLGYVESHNLNWFNQSFVALAPLLLLPIFIFFLEYSLNETVWFLLILKGYILSNILYGMLPSSVDFNLAFKKPIPIILFLIFIFLSFYKA